jgi:hypothetical protein
MDNIHDIGEAKKDTPPGKAARVKKDDVTFIECTQDACESTVFQPDDSGKTGYVPFQTQVCVYKITPHPTTISG